MSEIERLRDELNRLRHISDEHKDLIGFRPDEVVKAIEFRVDEIARLETEAADPWRLAQNCIEGWRKSDYNAHVVAFFDHLTAERDRLAARVAELEAAQADDPNDTNPPKLEIAGTRTVKYTDFGPLRPRDVSAEINNADDQKTRDREQDEEVERIWKDQQPDDPILDSARVLATACELLHQLGGHWQAADARAVWRHSDLSFSAKPYRLKGGDGETSL